MRVTLLLKKGHPARRVSPLELPIQLFVSHVNSSPCFVRRCKKSFVQEAKE